MNFTEGFLVTFFAIWIVLQIIHASRSDGRLARWNWFGQFGVWGMFTVGADGETQDFVDDGPVEIQFRDNDDGEWRSGFPAQAGAPFWYRILNPRGHLRDLMVAALEGTADASKLREIHVEKYPPLRAAIIIVDEENPRKEGEDRIYRLVRCDGERITEVWLQITNKSA